MKHVSKVGVYGGLALAMLFIVATSYWYRDTAEQELVPGTVKVDEKGAGNHPIVKKTDNYDIEVEYPQVPARYAGSVEANQKLKNIFEKRAADFEKDVITSLENPNLPEEFKNGTIDSYYDVSSSIEASSSRYISFFVSGEMYSVGQAHPSHSIDTFIFDIKNKKLVQPSELFVASSSYLQLLSKLTREDFGIRNNSGDADNADIDVSSNNDGFNPTMENFSRMLPIADGLMIYFGEYQVAPYVYGPQQSVIPYAKLKNVINKDGVLEEYIK